MDVFPLKRLYSTVANMTQARAIVYIDEYIFSSFESHMRISMFTTTCAQLLGWRSP